jgi:glyceraldehyde 3-phosphate dehydrogenase
MAVRVAINGFGRTGRCTFRAAHGRDAEIEIVPVNDLVDARTLGHLLTHDSVFGRFPGEINVDGDRLLVDGRETAVFAEPDPHALPWGDLVGVNFDEAYDADRHDIISNASCTTNCLAPVAKVLHEELGIRHGLMATVHAYTSDQMLQDGPHKDLRRARAAAVNMIPTSTGAAKALGLVVAELEGRLHGYAMRVPIPTGSVVDLTLEVERPTSVEEVNDAVARGADSGPLKGILAYSDEPLVSSDIVGSPYSAVFDSGFRSVIDGTCVKVLAWYDNEWRYANRLSELAERMLVPVVSSRG